MNLNEEAKAALERLRKYKTTNDGAKAYAEELAIGYSTGALSHFDKLTVVSALSTRDAFTVVEAMLELFPDNTPNEIEVPNEHA